MSRLLALALLGVTLLLPGAAHALTWWVDDDAQAQSLEEALATYWPDHDLAIRAGVPTHQREAIWYAGGELVMVAGERVRWQAAPEGDFASQVALVLSWLRELPAGTDAGWIPHTRPSINGFGVVAGGAGLRLPTIGSDLALSPASPAGHFSLAGGIAWPVFRIGMAAVGTFGEAAGQGVNGVSISRIFVGGIASLVAPAGVVEVENLIGFGGRMVMLRAKELPIDPQTVRLASFLLGVRVMGRATPLLSIGGGIGIGIDLAPIFVAVGPDASPELLSPVTLSFELAFAIGGARAPQAR